ncbi:hypothetical protein [Variovorax sp. KK3]|uniref:hypothetical protein n=1 Tax=Variovorax sp. KK3 TaxID=1855728 RepID=UPI002117ACBC|nr:hypothetical protein [Variovorax sp. KK3]
MSTAAVAQVSPALDRFSLSVGAFDAKPTVNAAVNTPYGTLGSGDLEGGRVTMPRISADFLIGDNHGLSLDYYRFKRDYGTGFANSFAVGPLGNVTALGSVNLQTKLEFGKVAYKYWIGSGNTVLGLGAGIAYYRASLNSSAVAGINGATATFSQEDSDDAIAPLLEVGVRHAITPDLRLFADLSGVRKGGSKLHGHIYNAAAGVEWFPVRNVGVVLSYGVTEIDLRHDFGTAGTANGQLKVKLHGPSAYVKARF